MWKPFLHLFWLIFGPQTRQLLPSKNVSLVNFLYYSSDTTFVNIQNGNVSSLQASGIVSGLPTIILIDGFLTNFTNSVMSKLLKTSLINKLGTNAANIIVLDWSALNGGESTAMQNPDTVKDALALYPIVVVNVPPVGKYLGDFLQFLNVHGGIPQTKVHIIGHSLGAHIAGCAGSWSKSEYNQTLRQLTGLDPAGPFDYFPLFTLDAADFIHSGDGGWVDLYHTGRNGMGENSPDNGDMDVYINGGSGQPGCNFNISNLLQKPYCDHIYSWNFYNYTIGYNTLGACGCRIFSLFGGFGPTCTCASNCGSLGTCGESSQIPVGYNGVYGTKGQYYLIDGSIYPDQIGGILG